MYFWIYGFRKMWLDKCPKSPVSENPSTSNMINGPKHWWNLNGSTFTIFIDSCEGYLGWKSLPEWCSKFWDCLLTHWLLMTSILFLIETFYSNIFRCNYLRNQKQFQNLFFHFVNLHSILNIFKKWMTFIADVFMNLRSPKDMVR